MKASEEFGPQFLVACAIGAGAALLVRDTDSYMALAAAAPAAFAAGAMRDSRRLAAALGGLGGLAVSLLFALMPLSSGVPLMLGLLASGLAGYHAVRLVRLVSISACSAAIFLFGGVAVIQIAILLDVVAIRVWSSVPDWFSAVGVGFLVSAVMGQFGWMVQHARVKAAREHD